MVGNGSNVAYNWSRLLQVLTARAGVNLALDRLSVCKRRALLVGNAILFVPIKMQAVLCISKETSVTFRIIYFPATSAANFYHKVL